MAAAWAMPTSSRGGSRRPTSFPAALNAVRPWRTRISTALVDHTSDDEVTGPPEHATPAPVGQVEAVPGPRQDGEADQLEQDVPRPALDRGSGVSACERPLNGHQNTRVLVKVPSKTRCSSIPIGTNRSRAATIAGRSWPA